MQINLQNIASYASICGFLFSLLLLFFPFILHMGKLKLYYRIAIMALIIQPVLYLFLPPEINTSFRVLVMSAIGIIGLICFLWGKIIKKLTNEIKKCIETQVPYTDDLIKNMYVDHLIRSIRSKDNS